MNSYKRIKNDNVLCWKKLDSKSTFNLLNIGDIVFVFEIQVRKDFVQVFSKFGIGYIWKYNIEAI